MLTYHLIMRIPADQYVPPKVLQERFPFLEVTQAPSGYELAVARGLLAPFMRNQSITPEELTARLTPMRGASHLFDPVTTADGEVLSIQRQPDGSWEVYGDFFHEPQRLMLTEIIAIIDYCGGLP